MSVSMMIFISIFLFAIGYAVSEARSFNLWKFLAVCLIIFPFINASLEMGLTISAISFGVGFMLPHFSVFAGIRDTVSSFIDSIRYKSIYDDIKRRADEVDQEKANYERATEEALKAKREYEEAKRDYESRQNRNQGANNRSHQEQQNKQKQEKSQKQQGQKQKQSSTSSAGSSIRDKYLKVLGLLAGKTYTRKEVKKAYRKAAMKHHPDRNGGKHDDFVAVNNAYDWLMENTPK